MRETMLTIFSTPKPFVGHIGIIQRNAIQSWLRLAPDIEIILFGDDQGAAEVAREFGIRHVPHIERNENGAKYLNSVFGQARELAHHKVLCYVNCDIMLTREFLGTAKQIAAWQPRFLMVGRRWNVGITEEWDFTPPDWGEQLIGFVQRHGERAGTTSIDYFVFPRGMYDHVPPLLIGRFFWDHWLIWKARKDGAAVVDVSEAAMAIHQNHDYAYHPDGLHGVWHGEEAERNRRLAGGARHLYTLEDATHRFTPRGIEPDRLYWLAPLRRKLRWVPLATWYPLLEATKPVRDRLGLRRISAP